MEVELHAFLILTLEGNFSSRHALDVCRLKSSWCPLNRRLSGFQNQCGCFAEDSNLFRLSIIEPQLLIRPALGKSLYRLSCSQIDGSLIIALRRTQSGVPRHNVTATCFRRAGAPARLTPLVTLIAGQLSFD